MNHPNNNHQPSQESLAIELLELSPDLLARFADGYLHLYTEAVVDSIAEAKTVEEFESAIDQSLLVELDPDELFSLFRLLADYFESIAHDFSENISIH